MIEADVHTADAFRMLTIAMIGMAVALFPAAIMIQGRRRSAWWAVIGCEIFMTAAMFSIMDHWGQPLVVYRTPLIFLGASCILLFVLYMLVYGGRPR